MKSTTNTLHGIFSASVCSEWKKIEFKNTTLVVMSVKHVFFCLRAKNAFLCTGGIPFPERSKSACVAFLNYKRFSIKWQSKRANCIARQRNRCSQSRKGKANKKHPHFVCQTRYLRSQFFDVNRLIIEIQKNTIIAPNPPTLHANVFFA
jgi:hypothetical protein